MLSDRGYEMTANYLAFNVSRLLGFSTVHSNLEEMKQLSSTEWYFQIRNNNGCVATGVMTRDSKGMRI